MVDNKCAKIFSTHEIDLSFQNTLTHENTLHTEFFISLRSILYSLNRLCLECIQAFVCEVR